MLLKPNCCKRPHLHAVKIVDESSDSQAAIFRCDACEAYWTAQVNAWAMLEGSSGEIGGFERLTTEQAIERLRDRR